MLPRHTSYGNNPQPSVESRWATRLSFRVLPLFMQAFESARLSLNEFRVRSGFACTRPRRNDVAEAIATVFWFFTLQHKTGCRTAYALERLFEPSGLRSNAAGERFHSSKWARYRAGLTRPRSVLPAVENKCHGANACLGSPLWPALTARPLKRPQLEALLLRLEPSIRSLVSRRTAATNAGRSTKGDVDSGLAGALERLASLDALAAMVVLLRLAHANGRTAEAFHWGRHVLRTMLLMGSLLRSHGVAQVLFDLIEERVMPMAQHEGLQPGFPAGSYLDLWRLYADALWRIKGRRPDKDTVDPQHFLGQRLLDDRYGYDYFHALNPMRMLADTSFAPASQRLFLKADAWLFIWGQNMLSVGGHRYPPVPAVTGGRDLWATRHGDVFSPAERAGAAFFYGPTPLPLSLRKSHAFFRTILQ